MKSNKLLFPESWQSKIAADCFLQISTTHKKVKTKDCNETGAYPVIDQGQAPVAGYIDDPSKVIEVDSPLCIFGDHTRAVKWVDSNFVPGADGTKVLQPLFFLFPRFAYHQLRNMEIPDKGYSRHFKFFKELWFGIPPLAEQKFIAEKLDTLLAQVEVTKDRLESSLETLKQFRQSVLAAAVSGKLTEDWIDEREAWGKYALSELCRSVSDGDHQAPPRSDEGIPFLVISNVSDGVINFNSVTRWVPLDYYESLKSIRKPEKRDILYTVTGSFGIPVIVDTSKPFCFQRHIAIIKPNHDKVNYKYLTLYLSSIEALRKAESVATGTAQKTVSLTNLRKFVIPLPSREEQEEIVKRVEKLLAGADVTEQQVNQALERVNNLTQSILAKAFRGELTEQWRKENPELISGENSAEALLKKIKAERADAKPKRKARTTSA